MKSFRLQKGDEGSGGWLGCLGAIIAIAIGRYMGLGVFILLIPGLVGWWLGGLASKKQMVKVVNFVAWSNLVTWFIPVVGMATSMFTLNFDQVSESKDKKLVILAIIGFIASVINAMAGIAISSAL